MNNRGLLDTDHYFLNHFDALLYLKHHVMPKLGILNALKKNFSEPFRTQ